MERIFLRDDGNIKGDMKEMVTIKCDECFERIRFLPVAVQRSIAISLMVNILDQTSNNQEHLEFNSSNFLNSIEDAIHKLKMNLCDPQKNEE